MGVCTSPVYVTGIMAVCTRPCVCVRSYSSVQGPVYVTGPMAMCTWPRLCYVTGHMAVCTSPVCVTGHMAVCTRPCVCDRLYGSVYKASCM